jgi:hypothetical protein
MEKFDSSCVTNLGRNAIAELDAGGSSLRLTRVQMGRGLRDPCTDIQTFTGLVDGVQYNDINSANTLVPYQTTIAFTVKGTDVIETFRWSELGIFARLDDGEEFLFAYAYSSNPDTLVGGSKIVDQYVFGIRFENSEKVTVELTVNQTVPLHADTHLSDGIDPIPTVTSVRDGLVPVGPNDPKLVLIASDPPHWRPVPLADRITPGGIPPLDGYAKHYLAGNGRWYRTTPFIMRDTTLYVDPAYSDIWPRFSTLAKALEYLSGENISAGVTVTVQLSDGTHEIDNVIKFDHPQAQQVGIIGTSQRQRTRFTHLKEDGYDLILRAESVKDLAVGMSVIIQGDGAEWNVHPGGHTIRHIEDPYIRVSRSLWGVEEWHSEFNLGASYIYYYKTKIDCPNSGLFFPDGIGHLSRMSIQGHWSPSLNLGDEPVFGSHGVFAYSRAFFSDLIISNFTRGIACRYAHFDNGFVCAYDCGDGILADDGASYTNSGHIWCNGNTNCGLYLQQSNGQCGTGNYYSGDNARVSLRGNNIGFLNQSSDAWLSNAVCQWNNLGIFANDAGNIILGNSGKPVWSNANRVFDLHANGGGYIGGWSSGGYLGSCNPPNNIIGSKRSFIGIENN